jgi:hypothetical protein
MILSRKRNRQTRNQNITIDCLVCELNGTDYISFRKVGKLEV